MSQQTASSKQTDALNPARLTALRRVELTTQARRQSQQIHAAVAVARYGADSPRALKARALLDAQDRTATSVAARRQELELVITALSETPSASDNSGGKSS